MIRTLHHATKLSLVVSIAAALFSTAAIGHASNGTSTAQADDQAAQEQTNQAKPQQQASSAGSEGQSSNAGSQASNLGEIMVTAQRYGTSLQTTPISVTALSPEILADRQVTTVQDLVNQVPGVQLSSGTAPSSQLKVTFRGARTETSGIFANGTVGIYLDGVIQPRPMGQFFNFFDVDQVEVLRGPQGTLYGRNTSGGAIKIQTKLPAYYWTGAVEVGMGNYSGRAGKVYLSGPIVADKLAFSFSAVHEDQDGFIYGLQQGRRIGDQDNSTERLKVLYQPSEKLTFDFSAYASQDRSEPIPAIPLILLPGVVDPYAVPGRRLTFSELLTSPDQSMIQKGASLNTTLDVTDNFQLVSITGFGHMDKYNNNDNALTAATQAAAGGRLDLRSNVDAYLTDNWLTQEFNGIYTGERLNAVVGLYYFREQGKEHDFRGGTESVLQRSVVKAPAVFAQATYTIVEGLSAVAGIRYTRETQDYFSDDFSVIGPQIGHAVAPATTPKLGLNWQINPNVFTYVSWTKGTRSGGFNARTLDGLLQPTPYGPEWVNSYEMGARFQSSDHRFRLNATLYEADYTDQQLATILSGNGWSGFFWLNAGASRVRGLELESNWRALDSLNLYAIMAFQDGKYTKAFSCRNQYSVLIDCTNKPLKGVPKVKTSLGFNYTLPIPALPGKLTINGSWDHNSVMANTTAGDLSPPYNPDRYGATPELDLFNASLRWTDPSSQWHASLEVRNLTDKRYVLAGVWASNAVHPGLNGYLGRPREVWVRLGYSF